MEAIKVAEFIINLYYEMNQPLSNLKLQKLLYFVQGASLAIYDKPAFDDDIEAWQYGPVVPNVYYPYSLYGPLDIKVKYDSILEDHETTIVAKFISYHYKDRNPFDLVDETHKEGSPWSEIYAREKKGKINNELISSYFKNHYLEEWFD